MDFTTTMTHLSKKKKSVYEPIELTDQVNSPIARSANSIYIFLVNEVNWIGLLIKSLCPP